MYGDEVVRPLSSRSLVRRPPLFWYAVPFEPVMGPFWSSSVAVKRLQVLVSTCTRLGHAFVITFVKNVEYLSCTVFIFSLANLDWPVVRLADRYSLSPTLPAYDPWSSHGLVLGENMQPRNLLLLAMLPRLLPRLFPRLLLLILPLADVCELDLSTPNGEGSWSS